MRFSFIIAYTLILVVALGSCSKETAHKTQSELVGMYSGNEVCNGTRSEYDGWTNNWVTPYTFTETVPSSYTIQEGPDRKSIRIDGQVFELGRNYESVKSQSGWTLSFPNGDNSKIRIEGQTQQDGQNWWKSYTFVFEGNRQ